MMQAVKEAFQRELASRRELAQEVSAHRMDRGLVDRDPVAHAVAEAPGHEGRVLAEPLDEIAIEKSAATPERLRQVPMI